MCVGGGEGEGGVGWGRGSDSLINFITAGFNQ